MNLPYYQDPFLHLSLIFVLFYCFLWRIVGIIRLSLINSYYLYSNNGVEDKKNFSKRSGVFVIPRGPRQIPNHLSIHHRSSSMCVQIWHRYSVYIVFIYWELQLLSNENWQLVQRSFISQQIKSILTIEQIQFSRLSKYTHFSIS